MRMIKSGILASLMLLGLGSTTAYGQAAPDYDRVVNGNFDDSHPDGVPFSSGVKGWNMSGTFFLFPRETGSKIRALRLIKTGSSIRQKVPTTPGQSYDLSFVYWRSTNGGTIPVEARAGSEVHEYPVPEEGSAARFTFTATAAETEIAFRAPKTDGEHGPYVGSVTVFAVDAATVARQSINSEYLDYSDWVRRGQFDKLARFYSGDFSAINSRQETQTATAVIAELGPVKERRKTSVRFHVKDAKADGADTVVTVERRFSFDQQDDGQTHNHVIVSQMTDTWTGGKGHWKLKKSVEDSRTNEVDGDPSN